MTSPTTSALAARHDTRSGLPRRLLPELVLMLVLMLALLLAMPLTATAQDGYRLRPGDVLRIEVVEDAGLNRNALIAPDGRIAVPLAGSLTAGGRTIDAVQADLVDRLSGSFATPPTVFVSIDRLAERVPRTSTGPAAPATIDIFVMGEAAKTGLIQVAPGTTVLQAFAQMGGFSKFAAKKRVQLRRDGKTYVYNYVAIEAGASNAGDTVLSDGDVIVVPQRRLFE